jgi:hypothetical protein
VRSHDARTVLGGQRDGGDRRTQVGHHDGAGEAAGRVRQHGGQCGAIAQMQVPVVGRVRVIEFMGGLYEAPRFALQPPFICL